jgi:hypothetical protein
VTETGVVEDRRFYLRPIRDDIEQRVRDLMRELGVES